MEKRSAARKIDKEPTVREYVPPNKKVVWRTQGGQTYNVRLDIGRREARSDAEIGGDYWFSTSFVNFPLVDRIEGEFLSEPGAHAASSGSRVKKREDIQITIGDGEGRCHADLNGRAILKELVDGLGELDLGPNGFFIIAHRG